LGASQKREEAMAKIRKEEDVEKKQNYCGTNGRSCGEVL
jgi:hypothetical protein